MTDDRATTPGPGLHARVRLELGALDLDVDLEVAPGEVVAVLGPNGAGKTSLLRAVAGLLPLQAGHVALRGRVLDEPLTATHVPLQERAVGIVFQEHLLFPHLSALDNVAFGLRARGVPRAQADASAHDWLDRVHLADHASARPSALSGGQAQRVALARALATDPALLLLDEPMAALDVDARQAIRRELRHHLDAFAGPCLLVTHEPLEAIALADRLVILEGGRIVQDGSAAQITQRPRSAWAARLVGLNLYRGVAHDHHVTLDGGYELTTGGPVTDGEVFVIIHPRAVALHPQPPAGSPRNTWRAVVDALDLHRDHVRVHLAGDLEIVAEITPAALADLRLAEGDQLWVAVKATEVEVVVA